MTFGLRDTDLTFLQNAFRRFPEIERVWVFGSRAKGTQRPGSDVDLAVSGIGVSLTTLLRLGDWLEEASPLPFRFDLVHLETLKNKALRAQIEQTGNLLYEKTASLHET
jgi:predicted nucleotidyltransferase